MDMKKQKAGTQDVGETAPVDEETKQIPIGTPDIWGNGNNGYVQPSIGVQGFNAVSRLIESMPIVMRPNLSTSHGLKKAKGLAAQIKEGGAQVDLVATNPQLYFIQLDSLYIAIYETSQVVGWLQLEFTRDKALRAYAVKGAFVIPAYRGKRLGLLLYKTALLKFGRICSSSNIGIMAVRTWKALSKVAKVELYKEGRERVDFDFGPQDIPIVDGKPITEYEEDFIFLARK